MLTQARQLEEEGTSLPVRTLHPQAATHHLCETATEVEPQAGAANLARVRIIHPIELLEEV